MKKIIIAVLIFTALQSKAQDSTKIYAIQLQAKLIEYLAVNLLNPNNDSLYQVYIDLRPKFRGQNAPSNNTMVTIDSIPTVELANLYNYTLTNAEGYGMSNNMKSQIATARTTNTYLDRLCTGYESFWSNSLLTIRTAGRKLLRGK